MVAHAASRMPKPIHVSASMTGPGSTRSGGAATGVEGMVLDRGSSEPKGRLRVRAKKVILSASAIDTVLLLRRSGVEDESGLLGHRLHVHPFATVAAMYDRPIEAWRGIPQSAYSDHYARFKEDGYGGYVLIPGFAHPGMGASVMPGMGAQHGELMKQNREYGAIRGTRTMPEGGDDAEKAKESAMPGDILSANGCTACHAVDQKLVGPGFRQVSEKYQDLPGKVDHLKSRIRNGGSGTWGNIPMPPQPQLSEEDLGTLARWIADGAKP